MNKLLELLENDSTLTHAQLAAMTGMTEGEVSAAVAQYEKDHVILGYMTGRRQSHLKINLKKME